MSISPAASSAARAGARALLVVALSATALQIGQIGPTANATPTATPTATPSATLNPTTACTDPDPSLNRIVGTAGDDRLHGTSGDDLILGLGGDDRIDARGGNDVLCGGDGWDTLSGEQGDDILDGQGLGYLDDHDPTPYHDLLQGGRGNDVLVIGGVVAGVPRTWVGSQGTAGEPLRVDVPAQLVTGQRTGRDRLVARGGGPILGIGVIGGSGDDVLIGSPGIDHLEGGRGIDVIRAGAGNDVVGRTPYQVQFRDYEPDRIDLGPGEDQVGTDGGNDLVVGGPDSDTFLGRVYGGRLYGGPGADRFAVQIYGRGGVVSGGGGRDEWVLQVPHPDQTDPVLALDAGAGRWTQGPRGLPVLNSGALGGVETYRFATTDSVRFIGSDSAETVSGPAPSDSTPGPRTLTVRARGGADSVVGTPNADVLDGGAGTDTVDGNGGKDTCRAFEDVTNC